MELNYDYKELSDEEIRMMKFMAKRLGFDHFIIAGYDSEEFTKHILSKGLYDGGAPKVSCYTTLAGAVFIISRLLVDFPFSEKLRIAVYTTINSILDGREIKGNINGREGPKGD